MTAFVFFLRTSPVGRSEATGARRLREAKEEASAGRRLGEDTASLHPKLE